MSGYITLKSSFANNEELKKHYTIAHKAFSIKQMYQEKFPMFSFPGQCQGCQGLKGCDQSLSNWEQTVLHMGIGHER